MKVNMYYGGLIRKLRANFRNTKKMGCEGMTMGGLHHTVHIYCHAARKRTINFGLLSEFVRGIQIFGNLVVFLFFSFWVTLRDCLSLWGHHAH